MSLPHLRRFASLFVITLPGLYCLALLPQLGVMPHNDYFQVLMEVGADGTFTHDPLAWLTLKSNEHTVTIPGLIYAANIRLSHGSNHILSLLTIVAHFCVLALLLNLPGPAKSASQTWLGKTAWGLFLAAMLFSPAGAHSFTMGFSGVIWWTANLFCVSALYLLIRAGETWISQIGILLLAAAGLLTYSTALSLLPVLLLGAILLRKPVRLKILLAASMTGLFAWKWWVYETPGGVPSPNHPGRLDWWIHPCTNAGSILASLPLAPWIGLAGIALAVLAAVLIFRHRNTGLPAASAPWLMLMCYGLFNIIGMAFGRSSGGIIQATSSRYTSLQAMFWIGLAGTLLALLSQRKPKWASLPFLATSTISLAAAAYLHGLPVLYHHLHAASKQPAALYAVQQHMLDADCIRTAITPWPLALQIAYEDLRALNHIPFNQPPPELPEKLAAGPLPEAEPAPRLTIDTVHDHGTYREIDGWIHCPQGPVTDLLLVTPQGDVSGIGFPGVYRPDVKKVLTLPTAKVGWIGFCFSDNLEELELAVKVESRPEWFTLSLAGEIPPP